MTELIDGKTVLYVGVLAVIILLVGGFAFAYVSVTDEQIAELHEEQAREKFNERTAKETVKVAPTMNPSTPAKQK